MTPVLITGCSSGIGAAIAARLARADWPVYATARRLDMLDTLREAGAKTLALDVTNEDSMRNAVAVIEREHGSVGALVNNAGFGQSGALEEVPIDALRRQFDTNVFGLLRLTQLVLPGMRRARQGRIVNMGSMGGRLTFPGGGAYHATKHALVALNDALRFEVRSFGIDVVLIEPGLIRTHFAATVGAKLSALGDGAGHAGDAAAVYADFNDVIARGTVAAYERGPMARMAGEPLDVARTIARAIEAPRPRARYTVGTSATFFLTLRRWLGDAGWDWFLRSNFAAPKPPAAG